MNKIGTKMIKRKSFFYSSNEFKKFKRIKKDYIKVGYPSWKAEQYSYDHIFIDRKSGRISV